MERKGTEWVAKYWDFVEDFGGTEFPSVEITSEQAISFRETAAAFLRATFPPPPGCVLEVIEAEYIGRFPVIAVGWNVDPEPHGMREYVARLGQALTEFVQAVDWQRLVAVGH